MSEPQEPRSASPEHPAPEELSELAFSPQDAPAGVQEHVQGCPVCAAELADLRSVLESLAQLPEPAVPVSVGIRLDAAIARAWQEAAEAGPPAAASAGADAGTAPASRAVPAARGGAGAGLWRKFVLPLGVVCLLVLGVFGAGKLLRGSTSAGSSASTASRPVPAAAGDPGLTGWVRSVLSDSGPYAARGNAPQSSAGSSDRPLISGPGQCADLPAQAGYNALATSQEEFRGQSATLVVYQNDQEPASRPVFAVVYAGSCPTASSVILDEGLVSR